MYFKNISNPYIATLSNCESEPIHIPGAIQPHGFLFCLTADHFLIEYCSANAIDFCNMDYEQLLGRDFSSVFGAAEMEKLRAYLLTRDFLDGNPISLYLGTDDYSCTITKNAKGFLVDAEPFPDGFQSLHDLYHQTRRFVAILERTTSLQNLCQTITEETRRITGYDRVMIYRFDEDFNGEIFAESRRNDLEPFLNLHYPNTDIPVQARKLYLRNLLRMIANVAYVPVRVYTSSNLGDTELDMSLSILRSVSPIHIEYLKNMGVEATLTVSLIHEKKLWGLISCHHYSPKNLPHYTRVSAQLQGHFLTSQISSQGVAEAFEAGQGINDAMAILMQHTAQSEADIITLVGLQSLLDITSAGGVAILFKSRCYCNGDVPDKEHILKLSKWLAQHEQDGRYVSTSLSDAYPDFASLGVAASGILYHSLISGGEHCIIWFRNESKKEVTWAGAPQPEFVQAGQRLSPRKSFEQWKQLVSLQSYQWTNAEQHAAFNFANGFQRQLSLILLRIEEARIRVLNEQLRQANEELESMNWISTHDLQEPLRKLQVFASQLLRWDGRNTMEDVMNIVRRMSTTASRMQELVNDIHAYTKVLAAKHDLMPVSLQDVISDVLTSLNDELTDNHAMVEYVELPLILGEPFLLRQLFSNLLRNAFKFSKSGIFPQVGITASRVALTELESDLYLPGIYHRILVKDNGIGFNNKYSESIFGMFKRLHGSTDYNGTGIGLAICRKVMQLHNGFITAESEEGQGASFILWFPVA